MTTLCIEGGRVLRPDMTVDRADVLVDQPAGEILAVGTDLDGERVLDATNALVIPGLVNAHTHVAMTLLRGYADDKPLDPWLREDIWPAEAELTRADVHAGAALGVLEMIRSGTTAFADMYFHVSEIADAVEAGGIRAQLGHTAVTAGKDDAAAEADLERSLEVADSLDGRANGRITTAVQPHSLTTVDGEGLERLARGARAADRPLHFHANETTDEVTPIRDQYDREPLSLAADLGLLSEGAVIAHCVHVSDHEIELLADAPVTVAHCPTANLKLASGIAPIQRLRNAGVRVAIGTDGPASNNDLDVLDELGLAALLGKVAADDASAVPATNAVRMATAVGADALGLNSGRIAAGYAADLAVIDLNAAHLTPVHDPVSHLAYAARGSDVRHTVCDGKILMRDREVLTFDAAAIRARAADRASALTDRVD